MSQTCKRKFDNFEDVRKFYAASSTVSNVSEKINQDTATVIIKNIDTEISENIKMSDVDAKEVSKCQKVAELRHGLYDIMNDTTGIDKDVEHLKGCLAILINGLIKDGHKYEPISITDLFNMLSTVDTKKNVDAIPQAIWKQVLSEYYHKGYIKLSTISFYNEKLICIIPQNTVPVEVANETVVEVLPALKRANKTTVAILDDELIKCIRENPYMHVSGVKKIILPKIPVSLITVEKHLRKLWIDGKLPFWKNPPVIRTRHSKD